MNADNKINVTVTSRDSNKWLQLATKLAKAQAEQKGIAWVDADVYVSLPEHGRCFTKNAGSTSLGAHG